MSSAGAAKFSPALLGWKASIGPCIGSTAPRGLQPARGCEGDAVARARGVPREDLKGTGLEERSTAWRGGIVSRRERRITGMRK